MRYALIHLKLCTEADAEKLGVHLRNALYDSAIADLLPESDPDRLDIIDISDEPLI